MEKESYFKTIGSYITLSIGLRAYLNYILHEDAFNRKHTLKLSDKYFSTLLFISTGTLRLYSTKEDEETTILFWQKNQFCERILIFRKV
jgi:L-amino acid N-acyltransferase YncA